MHKKFLTNSKNHNVIYDVISFEIKISPVNLMPKISSFRYNKPKSTLTFSSSKSTLIIISNSFIKEVIYVFNIFKLFNL